MSLITRMRRQKAVWWTSTGRDEYNLPTWGSPVEIDCRWEDVAEEFIGPKGTRELSNAIVYVDRDMKPGDVLLFGELSTGVVTDSPKDNDGAWEIQKFDKLPNLKATEFLRTAYL